MNTPIFIPPPIRQSKKCDRCGLQYDIEEVECPHCHNLSDAEVALLKQKEEQEAEGESKIGIILLFIAAVIIGIMLAETFIK
jgi:uncharacterized membrane protein YvbJ